MVGSFGLFVSTVANAQQISKEVLQRFNSSVATRVYDVTSKLSLSSKDQLSLAEAYQQRDNLLAEALKRDASSSEIKGILSDALISHYDSLMENVNFGNKSNAYLQKTFETIDGVKPLTDALKTKISTLFLPKCDISGCVYSDILREVLPKVLTDTTYYATLFSAEIDRKTTEATRNYPAQNGLSEKALTVAGNYISHYQRALLLVNYALPYSDSERSKMVYNIGVYYRPIIDSVLASNILMTSKSQFTVAINKKNYLGLTSDQVAKNAELQKLRSEYNLKNSWGEYNSTEFHRKNIRPILTEDQTRTVLQLWYQSDTQNECAKTWKELKKYNLVVDADSVSTDRDMYFYFLEKIVIPELYYDKPDMINEKLYKNDILFKPEILKRLDEAYKEEKAKAALYKGKNDSFVW